MSRRYPAICAWLVLLSVLFASQARAEHRVALLIGNSAYKNSQDAVLAQDLRAVAAGLETFGFRCQIVQNLVNDKSLKNAVEGFADRTPTRSTALLYFRGHLRDGSGLLGIDSRSKYALERAIEALSTKGGSSRILVFVDAPEKAVFKAKLPEACQLTFGKTDTLLPKLTGQNDLLVALTAIGKSASTLAKNATLIGKGSGAISSPDRFMQGKQAGDEWVNSMGIVFCWCPPGQFVAGSPKDEPARYPDEAQRDVTIKNGFWLSKYELTLSQRMAKRGPGRSTIARNKLHPMTMINHDDAKSMTRTFSASEGKAGRLPQDWQYALPTEDQWEYAARAGTTTRFHFGDDFNRLPQHANFADKTFYDTGNVFSNAAHRTLDDGIAKLAKVGSYQPNPWGLHDMYGNVAEWCINLAIRGGSWTSVPQNCRSAYRDSFSSRNEQNFIGYRLVIQKTPPENSKTTKTTK